MQKQSGTGNLGKPSQNQNQNHNQDSSQAGGSQKFDQKADQSVDQKADQKTDQKADQKGSQKLDQKAGQNSDQKSADKSGSGNLPDVLQNFNKDEVKRYAERAFHYAEAKPMQTIGLTVAFGAILGWLLTSRSGRSAVTSVGTVVSPFIMSWVKQNIDFSKIGEEITSVVHH
jgi:ElaB/YqjD/DUF883 family membrane-anchored ribosome-binding protein